MIARIVAFLVIASALLALILYSQLRPQVNYVSGVLEADEIRLGSRVGGRIQRVLVEEGDTVSAGDPLIEFEPYDLREREQQLISELAAREAELQRLRAGMREEEIGQAQAAYDQRAAEHSLLIEGPRVEEIAAAENRLKAAESELALARSDNERLLSLRVSDAVAKAEQDAVARRLEVAQAMMEVRKSELALLRAGARTQERDRSSALLEQARLAWELAKKGYRDELIQAASAARDAAQAALEIIRRQKEELVLKAPSAGYIDALELQPGDLVPANAPVMTLLDSEHLWVRAYVPQRFLQLQVGQRVRVTFDSLPGETFTGEVSFISHQAEFTPSNVQTSDERAKQVYRVRVMIPADGRKLRVGMTANVWLDTAQDSP